MNEPFQHSSFYYIKKLIKYKKSSCVLACFTSLSNFSTKVMFPDLGSTLKYSLEPGSKDRPYLTS